MPLNSGGGRVRVRESGWGVTDTSETDQSTKSIEIKWEHTEKMMTQMQLPAMLSTHPHYSLCRHLGLWGAEGTETSLFNSCFLLQEPKWLDTQLPIFYSNWFACLELKTFISHRLPVNSRAFLKSELWSVVSLKILSTKRHCAGIAESPHHCINPKWFEFSSPFSLLVQIFFQ